MRQSISTTWPRRDVSVGNSEEWNWLPGDPEQNSTQTVNMEIDPLATVKVWDRDTPISASRVRIWAVAAGGSQWNEYKAQDLLLVLEEDDQGQRWYAGAAMDTFAFTFSNELSSQPVDSRTKSGKAIEPIKGTPVDAGRLAQLLKKKGWRLCSDLPVLVQQERPRLARHHSLGRSHCHAKNVDYEKAPSTRSKTSFGARTRLPPVATS